MAFLKCSKEAQVQNCYISTVVGGQAPMDGHVLDHQIFQAFKQDVGRSQQTEVTDGLCQGFRAVNCEATPFVKIQGYPGEPKLN